MDATGTPVADQPNWTKPPKSIYLQVAAVRRGTTEPGASSSSSTPPTPTKPRRSANGESRARADPGPEPGLRRPDPGGAHGEGFQTGRTVGVRLSNSSIVISGTGTNGRADGYKIKRPCWYEPGQTAENMLKTQEELRTWWFHTNPSGTEEDFQKFLEQYKDKVGQDGRWWSPAYNAADPGGMACWSNLEGALWVPEGETPAGGITMEELLQIARAA